jgi:mono/diheme cytochrome c family protein
MPSWSQDYGGPLRNDQIEDLTQFVLNWQGPQPEGVRPEEGGARPTPTPAAKVTPGAPPGEVAQGDPARGEQVFIQNCISCHGPGAAGGALGPSLVRPEAAAQPDDWYRETITNGRAGSAMPAWGPIPSAPDIEDGISWIRSRQ